MDIAGHVSKQMLKHYSHIRMEAKRAALKSIVEKQPAQPVESEQEHSPLPTVTQKIEGQYPQKSPQSGDSSRACGGKKGRKSLKRIGSSGRTRTYNPSVNSRMLLPLRLLPVPSQPKNSEIDRPIFPHFSAVVIWAR